MDVVGLAEVVSAVAVVAGLGFAVSEVKRHRERTARESALALVASYQTPDFAQALFTLIDLPEGLNRVQLEERVGSEIRLIALLMTTWESLGVLACKREISLDLLDDFFSGPIILSWRKLRTLVEEIRRVQGRDTYFEWFQWLAERMAERESGSPPVPAHVQHRAWRA